MTTPSADRAALRLNVNSSRWLTELRQRADERIATYRDTRLAGDKNLAVSACRAVEEQARREERPSVAEAYGQKRVDLDL